MVEEVPPRFIGTSGALLHLLLLNLSVAVEYPLFDVDVAPAAVFVLNVLWSQHELNSDRVRCSGLDQESGSHGHVVILEVLVGGVLGIFIFELLDSLDLFIGEVANVLTHIRQGKLERHNIAPRPRAG